MAALQEHRAPLSDRQVEMMLGVLLRRKSAFRKAAPKLKPEDFAPHHKALATLWSVALDFYAEFNSLPSEEDILGEIERRMDEDPSGLTDEEQEMLDGSVSAIYGVKLRSLRTNIGMKFLRYYLEDRLADTARTQMQNTVYTPLNLGGLFKDLADRATQLQTVEAASTGKPFPKGWRRSAVKIRKTPTRCKFFDTLLNGGQGAKEVIGLLGPHGSCKTTSIIQVATNIAGDARSDWLENGEEGPLGISYLFFWEGTLDEMRLRALSCVGRIDRSTLEDGEWETMSTAKTLKPYEKRLFSKKLKMGARVKGERGRCADAQRQLNINLRLIDMTGNDVNNPSRGKGMVDEIAAIIAADQEHLVRQGYEPYVAFVGIDYLGAVVERYLDDYPHERKHLRHYLRGFPLHAKNKIAIPFDTTVWVLHQLSGDANSFAPGRIPKSTDAAEAKSFRENLDFALVFSNPDPNAHLLVSCDKHRRAPMKPNSIIRIDGHISVLTDVSTHMRRDPQTLQIVPASDLTTIHREREESRHEDGYSQVPCHDETSEIDSHAG